MVFQGQIQNGVAVFPEHVPLPDGTAVRVEPVVVPLADFWQSCSLDELARRQGIIVPRTKEEMLGGWPEEELDDGFENIVGKWRECELEQTP